MAKIVTTVAVLGTSWPNVPLNRYVPDYSH
jgi:hypothetical protein